MTDLKVPGTGDELNPGETILNRRPFALAAFSMDKEASGRLVDALRTYHSEYIAGAVGPLNAYTVIDLLSTEMALSDADIRVIKKLKDRSLTFEEDVKRTGDRQRAIKDIRTLVAMSLGESFEGHLKELAARVNAIGPVIKAHATEFELDRSSVERLGNDFATISRFMSMIANPPASK